MRKLYLMSPLLTLVLAGCGNDGTGVEQAPASTPAQASPTVGGASPAPASTPSVPQLSKSEPVSVEGAASLNESCNVEGVDGQLFESGALQVKRSGAHEISGWVVDAEQKAIPRSLTLVVSGVGETGGTYTSTVARVIERAGVAETRGFGTELANSGFAFQVDMSALPAGLYHVYLVAREPRMTVCDPGRQIQLAD